MLSRKPKQLQSPSFVLSLCIEDDNLTSHILDHPQANLSMGLEKQKIILCFPWLNKYNPIINWNKGEIKWQLWKSTGKDSLKRDGKLEKNNNQKSKKLLTKKKWRTIQTTQLKKNNIILIKLLQGTT